MAEHRDHSDDLGRPSSGPLSAPAANHTPVVTALTFELIHDTNRARCERWHPGFPDDEVWSVADWSNALAGEVGELANVVKKLRRHECGQQGALDPPVDDLRAQAADEAADVFLYLDLLCTRLGLDLPAAIASKFNRVSERQAFPERLPERP